MSQQTVRICDIRNCGCDNFNAAVQEATENLTKLKDRK